MVQNTLNISVEDAPDPSHGPRVHFSTTQPDQSTLHVNGVRVARHSDCASVQEEIGPVNGVYTLRVRGRNLDVYCSFYKGVAFALLTSFTQPAGSDITSLLQADYEKYFRVSPIWIHGNSSSLPLSAGPANASNVVVQSQDWREFLVLGKRYWLRQRFFKGPQTAPTHEFDAMWKFTYNGYVLQDDGSGMADQSWVLTDRTVLTDSTTIAWNVGAETVRFWLPFTSAIPSSKSAFTACSSYAFDAFKCNAGDPNTRRFGSCGIVLQDSHDADTAGGWAPYIGNDTTRDIVYIHGAPYTATIYGQTNGLNGPITLQYWLAAA